MVFDTYLRIALGELAHINKVCDIFPMKFDKEFEEEIKAQNPNWLVRGIITVEDNIYAFGTDTKILSRVFELLTYPFVKEIADKNDLTIEIPKEQTIYPDFTLYEKRDSKKKIAIDVKSTYRKGADKPFGFTLGSYTSFLRNGTKNILYPYEEYTEHWIIGFIYDRIHHGSKSVERVELNRRQEITPPFANVEFFVQEKYKIAGVRPGSGNTANIGSIQSKNISDFKNGTGPFAKLGEHVFRDYWASYSAGSKRSYANLNEYLAWKKTK